MKKSPSGVSLSQNSGDDGAAEHKPQYSAGHQEWSIRMVESVMERHPLLAKRWAYEWGVLLKSVERVWLRTRDRRYFDYIKRNIDEYVTPDGSIKTYRIDEYNLDQINTGKLLFRLHDETGDGRYKKAAYLLREQLRTQPRTSERGFWHKQIYPYQMWLDGIYMAGPFHAEFAKVFGETGGFDDVAHQVILIEGHTRDTETGLLYHGWDESRNQRWANPETGCSPHFWGRAIGWYAMAIPDILDHLPKDHPKREKIISIFADTIKAVTAVQDRSTGLWYQVLDQGSREGNYLEASGSCMFVYAMVKGVRKGYITREYLEVAERGYAGILEHFIRVDEQGLTNLDQICSVAGLGGEPYRDGSFEYYTRERIATNDYKGVGPFILASVEIEELK